jgi:P27 family predicted phage terminase small subunit
MPRARKPLALHALAGTEPEYSPDPILPAGRPKFPKNISREARASFKRLCALLEARRALTPGDADILRLYCVLFDRHAKALRKIEEEGEVCTYYRLNNRGESVPQEKENLWLAIAQDCESKMTSILRDLGLTPNARARVKATSAPKTKELVPGSVAWLLAQPKVSESAQDEEEQSLGEAADEALAKFEREIQ